MHPTMIVLPTKMMAPVTDATKDHTLVRKPGKCGESDCAVSAGTDTDNSQWIVKEDGNWDDIGQHTK